MRIAALYDIHGNLPALEAVLRAVQGAGVDRVVIGGDVLPGPMPRETLACLLNLPVPTDFLYGNGEIAVLEAMAGRNPSAVPQQYWPIIHWTADQLDGYYEVLAGWPRTLRACIAGMGEVLFCHATPRDENETFTHLTPENVLLPIFEGRSASVVVCGHTHMQYDRTIGSTRVVNAGSVGMPFGEPGADWLLLGPDIQLRHTPCDLNDAADRVRLTSYPDAENFAAHHIIHPPSQAVMLEVFSRAVLKA